MPKIKSLLKHVDEISFNLNGSSLEKWLLENTSCDVSGDKQWWVFGINRQ